MVPIYDLRVWGDIPMTFTLEDDIFPVKSLFLTVYFQLVTVALGVVEQSFQSLATLKQKILVEVAEVQHTSFESHL